jgi:hypothetical protein
MADQEAFGAPCITNTLRKLLLDYFRGGAAKLAFAIRVLATALDLKPHTVLPHTRAADACALLLECLHASTDCEIPLFE